MAEDVLNQIVRRLYSMSTKTKDVDIAKSLDEERYQRTWTDEGIFASRKPRPGFRPLSFEQRIEWELLARKGKL